MRTPEITRQIILQQAGMLFNTKGYKATSISDITTATGLTKGALYRHFTDKEALEQEAFTYLMQLAINKLGELVRNEKTAPLKLKAVLGFFKNYITNPMVEGGCPLLNAAIEVDDANVTIKTIAQQKLKVFEQTLVHIVEKGIQYKQLQSNTDAAFVATVFIASLEGGIMMSKLHQSNNAINKVVQHLQTVIDSITI